MKLNNNQTFQDIKSLFGDNGFIFNIGYVSKKKQTLGYSNIQGGF